MEMNMEKSQIKDYLKGYSVLRVSFEKKDRSIRNMICTQDMEFIPMDSRPKPVANGEVKKELSDDVARVYDFEAQGWRSFSYDSVIEMNFYLPRGN